MKTKIPKFRDKFIKCPKCGYKIQIDSKEYQEIKYLLNKLK